MQEAVLVPSARRWLATFGRQNSAWLLIKACPGELVITRKSAAGCGGSRSQIGTSSRWYVVLFFVFFGVFFFGLFFSQNQVLLIVPINVLALCNSAAASLPSWGAEDEMLWPTKRCSPSVVPPPFFLSKKAFEVLQLRIEAWISVLGWSFCCA